MSCVSVIRWQCDICREIKDIFKVSKYSYVVWVFIFNCIIIILKIIIIIIKIIII